MMSTKLADILRAAGLNVVELPGWKTRGRPGSFKPVGVLWHHTGATTNGRSYAAGILTSGRSDLPGPLCQLSIDRQGTVYVIAAGRANHAGKAKSVGSVAAGDGNTLYYGIEFQNSGTEGWKSPQYDAGIKATAAIQKSITGNSARAVAAHYETSTTGKWDPGDPKGVSFRGARVLDMGKVRGDVGARLKGNPVGQAKPTRVSNARSDLQRALTRLDAAVKAGRGAPVRLARDAVRDALKRLPAK
jgi:hypothetical protein